MAEELPFAALGALPEVQRFRDFLRIPSVSHTGPSGTYARAVSYLRGMISELWGVQRDDASVFQEHEFVAGKPVLVATLKGQRPELKSVVLNSHYDVVPTVDEQWSCDPFEAHFDARTGEVYGRGTQDMKCVCVQYIEALARLKARGERLERTVHLTFMPDEEIGGTDGMGYFVESDAYKALNAGVALDEGLAHPEEGKVTVFYGERAVWWLLVRATGPTGHASRFVENTAMEKLIECVQCFLKERAAQRARLYGKHDHDPQHELGCSHAVAHKLGDVVTINLTALQGGVSADGGDTFALNVIPTDALAGFDVRIPPSVPLDEVEAKIAEWTADEGLSYEFTYKTPAHYVSNIDPDANPFWKSMKTCLDATGLDVDCEVFPAGTDGRYMRGTDIPVFGFSPMPHTQILLHDHNERLHAQTFMDGIAVYESLVPALANTPAKQVDSGE